MLARRIRRCSHRRGSAIIEFAVVAPILMTFILGIIEIGRLVMVAQVSTNASREGVRYAAQGKANSATVETYVRDYLADAGLTGTAAGGNSAVAITTEYLAGDGWTATDNPSALAAGTPVRTRVVVNFNRQSWLPAQFFVGSNAQVQGVAVMRKE